jgi:hypothetical protein
LIKNFEGEIEMKNYIFIFTIIVLSFVSAFGQNATDNKLSCTSQTVEKISSRGISLGMGQEEVLNLFAENGKLTTVISEYLPNEGRNQYKSYERDYQYLADALRKQAERSSGFSLTVLIPKDKIKFDGIERYYLAFLDDRLASFTVDYSKPKWENQTQFINKMSEFLNLPKQQYFEGNEYILKCGDYKVTFSRNYNESIYEMSVSANIDGILQQRRKKDDDEQREKDIKVFKP